MKLRRHCPLCVLSAILLLLSCARNNAVEKHIEEAGKFAKADEPAKAVEVMERAVKEYPKSARAHAFLGLYTGMKAGRTTDFMEAGQLVRTAFEHLDRAATLDSLDPDVRFYRGLLSVQVPDFFGKLDPGVQDLEFVLRRSEATGKPLAPDRLVSTWSLLGTGYQKQDKLDKATEAWRKVVELSSDTAATAQAKAHLAAIGAQDTTTAPATAVLPDDPAALLAMGRRLLDSGDTVGAAEPLRKAARLDSTNLEVMKLLARTLEKIVAGGYDERIALNTDLRTRLAFEYYRALDAAVRLAPGDMALRLRRGAAGVYTPFFVGRLDDGIKDLEAVVAANVDDETRAEALFLLGTGYRRKGTSYWTKVATKYGETEAARQVLETMRPRLAPPDTAGPDRPHVTVTFVLGFQDELEPQTAVWVEDDNGKYVKTLYVSGFSGHAKKTQVDLPLWARASEFRGCDAVTGASVDLGQHVYTWDMKDYEGRQVQPGSYVVKVEVAWWPSMKGELASARLAVGSGASSARAESKDMVLALEARYLPR